MTPVPGYGLVERTPSVEDYNRVRGTAGSRVKYPEAVRVGLSKSVYAVCVEREGEVVGFERIIGDGAISFEVVDMVVLPEHQGNDLGNAIMEAVTRYLIENALPGPFFGLFADSATVGFYEKHGFRVRDSKSPGMYGAICQP